MDLLRFLKTPITPPLGVLRIRWSPDFGLNVWHEPGGEPLRVSFLFALAALALAIWIVP